MINPVVLENLEKSEDKATEKALKRFEKKIKAQLPKDYREFLLQTNGGYTEKVLSYPFTLNGKPSASNIDSFYGLSEEEGEGSLIENFDTFRDKDEPRMLDYMIPIGEDEGGNQIVLLLNKKEYGHVYFWDHESEIDFENMEEGESDRDNCHPIAKSFTEFLNLLKVDDE
jgi:cell wall assembly regulator SMI1